MTTDFTRRSLSTSIIAEALNLLLNDSANKRLLLPFLIDPAVVAVTAIFAPWGSAASFVGGGVVILAGLFSLCQRAKWTAAHYGDEAAQGLALNRCAIDIDYGVCHRLLLPGSVLECMRTPFGIFAVTADERGALLPDVDCDQREFMADLDRWLINADNVEREDVIAYLRSQAGTGPTISVAYRAPEFKSEDDTLHRPKPAGTWYWGQIFGWICNAAVLMMAVYFGPLVKGEALPSDIAYILYCLWFAGRVGRKFDGDIARLLARTEALVVTAGTDALIVNHGVRADVYLWERFVAVRNRAATIGLMFGKNTGISIPKTAFQTDDDADRFYESLLLYWQPK